MSNFFQVVFAGMVLGLIYSVIALGYQATYSTSKTLNFGQGEAVALGGLLGFTLAPLITFWGALPVVALAGAGLGLFTYYAAVAPAIRRGSESGWILGTIALGPLVLKNAFEAIWGKDDLAVAAPFANTPFELAGILILPMELLTMGTVLLAVLALGWFMARTRHGKAVTAVAINSATAELMGIRSSAVVSGSYALSGALAGLAGLLIAPLTTTSASMGVVLGLKAFQVAVLGGLTSVRGVLVGGLFIGVLDAVTAYAVSSRYKEIPGLLLLLLMLSVRPTG
ncbi:branched-chain amino acid ABC transporter permease [Massilia glaciei]|uniref:Branched-chain amino acid ABC transporter permease n=1 Tax=Massilia glaciei TaxID=1524097 RepID=A0A2U2HLS9_9BURK|nr:branched-chain amino acid ABC transporter permease [Massilia glaciei]PWF48460.1 branched-chain amino acid ABC transporter permease [Massilia glaciei]